MLRSLSVVLLLLAIWRPSAAGTIDLQLGDPSEMQPEAFVAVQPSGPTGRTGPTGRWLATLVPEGNYHLSIWRTQRGGLLGAVTAVTVPAVETVRVEVDELVEAEFTYNVIRYGIGSEWQYNYHHTAEDGNWSAVVRLKADRETNVGEQSAVVLVGTKDGEPWCEEVRASTRDGLALYSQRRGEDTLTFDPPLQVGPVMPLDQEWAVFTTVHHSDGSPDEPGLLRCRFKGREVARVPAGSFWAAKFEMVTTLCGEVSETLLWTHPNAGVVWRIDRTDDGTNMWVLTDYTAAGVPTRPQRERGNPRTRSGP